MAEYFPTVKKIKYEGPDSKNPLAFKHYKATQKVLGKTMEDHFRFAVCYWHTFKGLGTDPFGGPTMIRSYDDAPTVDGQIEQTMDAAFEFISKLGVRFWCFHDADIAPEGETLDESQRRLDTVAKQAKKLQKESGIKLLWGTSNMFSHRRFMSGAATNPDPAIFAYAGAKVKKAMEVTKYLGGEGYVFWGGREGYETLLNTDMGRELDHLAVDYKEKIGFKGQFFIEPKPKEPTKHQYDFDAASCHAFLQKYDLDKHLKLNIEANHATLAGHTFHHELEYAAANDLLGSVDANRGDELLGWDTDQFPTNLYDTTLAMYTILKAGGFKSGGLNFDAKLRRQSIDPEDLFHAHIGAMDAFARGLKAAGKMVKDKRLEKIVQKRYAGWDTAFGKKIESGKATLDDMDAYTRANGEPEPKSGQQELLENILNEYIV